MGTTDFIVKAMVVLFCISALFMLSQIGMRDINPSSSIWYNCEGGLLSGALMGGNCTSSGAYALSTNISDRFASQSVTVSQTTGDVFTDTFTAAKTWLFEKMGLGYVYDLLSAPYGIINVITHMPALAAAISAIFYLVMLFLLISWVMGR